MGRRSNFQSLLFLFLLVTCFSAESKTYAPIEFYLVDKLDLNKLSINDKKLLDSCLSVFHVAEQDTDRVNALVFICDNMVHQDWSKYQRKQLSFVEGLMNNYPYSRPSYLSLKRSLAKGTINMGIIYRNLGDIEKSYTYNKKGLELSREVSYLPGIGLALNNIGGNYDELGKLSKALSYYQGSMKIQGLINNTLGVSAALNNIACIYESQGDLERAMEYFEKGLIISKGSANESGVTNFLSSLGVIYFKQGKLSRALKHFSEALKKERQFGHKVGMAKSLNYIGCVHEVGNDFSKALVNYQKALDINEEINNKPGISRSLYYIGFAHMRQKEWDSALVYLEESLELSKELGFPENIKTASGFLAKVYENLGQEKKALKMHRLFVEMKDSLNDKSMQRRLIREESYEELEKQRQKIGSLYQEQKIKERQYWFTIGLFVVFIVAIIIGVRKWVGRKKKHFEEELEALREHKGNIGPLMEVSERIKSIPVNVGKRILIIKPEEVAFFKTQGRYVFLINRESKSYIVDNTLSKLETTLPENFVRVHRSCIINNDAILEIRKTNKKIVVFVMKDEENTEINSSRGYAENVRTLIRNFKEQLA